MTHYYNSGMTPNEYGNRMEGGCLLVAPHSANSGRQGSPGLLVWSVEVTILTSLHPLTSTQGILYVCKSGVEIVNLPLSGKQMVTHVLWEARAAGHSSSKDLRVHSRDLEGILLPSRVECIGGVPQVTMLRVVLAHQCLPCSVLHCLSTRRSRSKISVPVDHLRPIENHHYATKLHASWPRGALDLYSGALFMPNWNNKLWSWAGTVGDSLP
jgi:hypothetical protein